MVRVILPFHLRTLAHADAEIALEVAAPVTQRSVLDALEARYPMLRGAIRDHDTLQRRPFLRFFACEEDLSHESPDAPLPETVVAGKEPLIVIGAIAGGSHAPAANDLYDLERFVTAQDSVYERVVAELRAGQKRGHWIWFIFPQLKGLGQSAMSMEFGIASRAEAQAYLQHPQLGPRLRECTELVLNVDGRSSAEIFGDVDSMKFRSCMTLFSKATGIDSIFDRALQKYFDGQADSLTLQRLR